MVKVKLGGILGKEFGEEWNLNVKSPREAVRAIAANNPLFKNFIYANKNLFFRFKINDKDAQSRKQICVFNEKLKSVEICPVFVGGMDKNTFGTIQIIAGAILIIAGIIIGVTLGWTGVGGAFAVAFIFAGLALLASGVITLLTPTPEAQKPANQRRSNLFDSGADTATQGIPVPLIYGTMFVEGFPVASSILTKDDAKTVALFEKEKQKEAEQAAKDAERARKKAEKEAKKKKKKNS